MNLTLEIVSVLIGFLVLLLGGMAIPFAIGLASLAYLLMALGPAGLKGIGLVTWASLDSFTLTALPLFVLMSEILLQSRLSDQIYNGLGRLVRRLPGGLLQTNIVGCALFAAVSGSSLATAAAIGTVALPELKTRGYAPRISAGSIAAGGTLGILIPPSLSFIIYGSFTDSSIAALFMAGVVPGLLLTLMFMLYVGCFSIIKPNIAPREKIVAIGGETIKALIQTAPFIVLIGGVLSGIYFGLVTPTEAGALGVALSIVVVAATGRFNMDVLWRSLRAAVNATGSVMLIVLTAFIFAYAAGMAGVPHALAKAMASWGLSKYEFLLFVVILYLILGMLMESIGIMVVTIPLLFPMLQGYGIDVIWFGVVLTVLIEIGMITPPFGMNLFVIQGIWPDGTLEDVTWGAMPFVFIMLGLIGILVLWPELATWLPAQMSRR